MAREERTVSDLMLQGQTNSNSIEYFEQTTFTNAAAEVAESAQGAPVSKPEAALDWTLRTEPVQTIAVWIPVTRQALEDVSQLESTIRGELSFMVRRREETQLLVGDGTSPNISGILDRSTIQTTAVGAGGAIDAVYTAMQLVRGSAGSGFAEPTAVVAHPNDWTAIKLSRTTDGIYLWGNPSDEGPDRIWGKEVRQTTGMTENTILVGAFRPYAQIMRRTGISVVLSTEHASFFIQNQVAVLAEERLALKVTRPTAFCTVTGA
jgi:HK97 family phage major capsid protein